MIVDVFGIKLHTTVIEIILLVFFLGGMMIPIYLKIKKELKKQRKEEH
ncbi:MAG: hypothetical protein GXO22_00060 [Aquificae bacterium]|nr:hypothetical protein [Aquificota bacterium]